MKECDRTAIHGGLSLEEIKETVLSAVADETAKRVLLIPPDYTRYHSGGGYITNVLYHYFTDQGAAVDILPALGTHHALTPEKWQMMFLDIPRERMITHDWRNDLVKIGSVPADFVANQTEGCWTEAVPVEINRRVVDGGYDLILSIGQVVPHEVVGMANHAKNLFVGVGGSHMINDTHMISAVYGIERIMGRDHTPVRAIFDWAFEHCLHDLPIGFIQTVTTTDRNVPSDHQILSHGIFCGKGRRCYEAAVALAQQKNVIRVQKPIQKCVVYLDPLEFQTTWIGNKSVYRTRMAIADGGELLILAPGVSAFGEDKTIDSLIRKYGYRGRDTIMSAFSRPENEDLHANMSAAAHLIHGSSEGRFKITYAVQQKAQEEIKSVGYQAASCEDMLSRYHPAQLQNGWNTLPDGEEIYFIDNPAIGLWMPMITTASAASSSVERSCPCTATAYT
ncbi:MAG: DUF2088 domain-containing protein [Clostridia bacterium]|nr:DUF2088 domain-containing protein [Clostridia bacterium]